MSVRPDHPHLRLPDTPRRQVRCPVCDRYAEPMTDDGRCWLCLATARRFPPPRLHLDHGRPRTDPEHLQRIADHAERVSGEQQGVSS